MVNGRRGFTLVEMLIVTVLGSLLLMATYQVLITNQRTYASQSAQIQNQQVSRASIDVLFAELREISASGGDILEMGADSLRVRVMRRYGLVCTVTLPGGASVKLTAKRIGDWFAVNDSAFVFADGDVGITTDDVWVRSKITAVDTTKACGTDGAQQLTFSDSALITNAVASGAPVRSYTNFKYGLVTYDGQYYLGRQEKDGTAVPMVGPLGSTDSTATAGVRFRYLDSLGAVTTTPANVRQIQVTVRTWADVTTSQGQRVADSVTISVYPRN
jgi:prepilin-type N-terminal cleavage/methylation domain-containing protein